MSTVKLMTTEILKHDLGLPIGPVLRLVKAIKELREIDVAIEIDNVVMSANGIGIQETFAPTVASFENLPSFNGQGSTDSTSGPTTGVKRAANGKAKLKKYESKKYVRPSDMQFIMETGLAADPHKQAVNYVFKYLVVNGFVGLGISLKEGEVEGICGYLTGKHPELLEEGHNGFVSYLLFIYFLYIFSCVI